MRGTRRLAAAVLGAVLLGASPADASISFDLLPVDNSALLTGYSTYDMRVTTDTDWTAAVMLLELNAGSIYQHGNGADTGPTPPAWAALSPGHAFDTYITGSIAGGAGDLGGTGFAFGTDRLDVTWYNFETTDIGTTTIGRLTLTNDAAGNLSLMLSASEHEIVEFDVAITADALPSITQIIKEPAPEPEPEPELGLRSRGDDVSYIWNTFSSDIYYAPTDPVELVYPNWWESRSYDFVTPTFDTRSTSRSVQSGFLEGDVQTLRYPYASTKLLYGDRVGYPKPGRLILTESGDSLTDTSMPEPVIGVMVAVCVSFLALRRHHAL